MIIGEDKCELLRRQWKLMELDQFREQLHTKGKIISDTNLLLMLQIFHDQILTKINLPVLSCVKLIF